MHPADPDPVVSFDPPATAMPMTAPVAPRRLRALPLAIAVVVVLGGSALFMSGYSMGRQSADQPGTPALEESAFEPFWDTYATINDRYAGGDGRPQHPDPGRDPRHDRVPGRPVFLVHDLGRVPHQSPGNQRTVRGIGAEIATQASDGSQGCTTLGPDCRLLITNPIEGSPAKLAGLLAGDLVLEADGVSLDGLSVEGARDRIRGPKGSVVTLTIMRGVGKPFAVAITRDVVQSREVESEALAGGTVGYIQLKGFSDAGAGQLRRPWRRTSTPAGRS